MSATARVMGASVTTVSKWVKKRGQWRTERLTRFLAWRTSGRPGGVRASVMAFDEMWTYLGIRRGERRQDLWIWTAVVEERDVLRGRMYEVGGRDESAFLRLLDRLPGADRVEQAGEVDIEGCTKSVEMLKHLLAIALEDCLNKSRKSINTAR